MVWRSAMVVGFAAFDGYQYQGFVQLDYDDAEPRISCFDLESRVHLTRDS